MSSSRGFTLIEIVIVLAIMAIAAGLSIGMMGGSFHSLSKNEAAKLVGAIKYAYNESVTKNLYHRLVFDFESQTYWLESSSDSFLIENITEDSLKNKSLLEDKADQDSEAVDTLDAADDGEGSPVPTGFTEVDPEDSLVRKSAWPEEVILKDVYISHQEEPLTQGRAHLHFFPRGMTELAVINFSDMDEKNFISIVVNPVTGRSKVQREYVEYDKLNEK